MRVITMSTLRVVYRLNRLMHMKYSDTGYMQVLRITSGARLALDRCWLLSLLKARVKFQWFLSCPYLCSPLCLESSFSASQGKH